YIGTITDISDRKRTEDRLLESEERYATLVEAATVGIFRTDADGLYTYVNDRYCQISGITRSVSPLSATAREGWLHRGIHPDDRDSIATEWQESERENRPFRLEYRFQHPDGAVSWVYGQSVAELGAEGQIVGYVGTITDISDRKGAEQKLQQLNQELEAKVAERTQELHQVNTLQRAILDGADYSIISTNPTGIIQTFNAAAEKMLGYNAAEIIGKFTPAFIHDAKEVIDRAASLSLELEQDIPPGFEVFVAKARQGIVSEAEWTYIRKDSSRFPVSLSITALTDIKGQTIGFLGIAKDISDRLRAEAELQKLSDRLALSLKSGAIGCWEWDIQNLIVWDERMYELYGVTKQSDSRPVYDIWVNALHPEDRTHTETLRPQALNGEAEYDTEYRVIHPDGSIHFIKAYGVVVRDAQGNPQSMIGINFDISDRKQAELERQQLIQELSAFKQALDRSAIVVITNPKGAITYVNDRFCVVSGYSHNELIGQTHRIVKSGYHPPSFFQNLWRTISGGQVWRGEICNRSKNGSPYWVASTIVPFLDKQGRPFQYLAIRFDITARKLAEATLQHENTFRQQIVENMAEGLCVFHQIEEFPFVRFTVWNQQMQAITGYCAAEINRLGWYQSLYPNPQTQKQAIAQLDKIGKENPIREEKEIQRQDGQRRTISISTSFLSGDDGKIYVLALIQDITDRQQTEQENRQLKERLEFLLFSSPAMIYSCKPYGDYGATFMSKNIEAILGYKAATFLSTPGFWANHIHPEDTQRVFADLSALFEQDNHSHEYRFLHRDGYYIWMRDELRLVRDKQGTPTEIVGYFADISALKQAESALKQQLAAIEAAIDGIAIIQESNYLYVNQAHLKLFGYDRPVELLGKSWKLSYSPLELERFEREVFPVLERDRAWQGEAIAIRKDGSTFAEGLSLTLTEDGLLICVCRDISDRKQYEAQLQQSNQELIRATRLKDEFLANMSHELRTPLNAILGMSEGLQEGVFGIVNEPQIKALQTIERSGSHLLELINDILDVAKIESGQMELDCTPVSVNHLCQSSLAFVQQQAMQKCIQLVVELPLNLPDLLIDERRIRQVLINLLNNAVKFTTAGGRITLEVSCQQRSGDPDSADSPPHCFVKETLRIAVIDTGIGIAPEDIDKLFQPFVQIDSALNREYTGTGLGLALVKRIVELHGGLVSLTSEVGVGSCFAIDLPSAAGAPSSSQFPIPNSQFPIPNSQFPITHSQFPITHSQFPIPNSQFPIPNSQLPISNPLILLAEDNEATISTVSSYLRAKGYRILLAKNGQEAIALAQSENPNLILMDIQMPGIDGIEAMRQIRLYPNLVDVPIVALTALAMTGDRDRCLEAGANDYMTKPVKLKQLAAIIQQFLTLKKTNS
ncbi:MAG: PAS domain S-box protein, partial [Microcoleus sp.]